jgi:transcriptional regulator with XRE-family HTH domain
MRLPHGCGGVFRAVRARGLEVGDLLGLEPACVVLHGGELQRCDGCGEGMVEGAVLDAVTRAVAALACAAPEQLSGALRRLCRSYLGLNQTDLGERLGVLRKTVFHGEKGRASPQFDLMMRALVVSQLAADGWLVTQPRLAAQLLARLGRVSDVAPVRRPRFEVTAALLRAAPVDPG